jgi:hypothetical protein
LIQLTVENQIAQRFTSQVNEFDLGIKNYHNITINCYL